MQRISLRYAKPLKRFSRQASNANSDGSMNTHVVALLGTTGSSVGVDLVRDPIGL